jgi:hypothetical protein
MEMTIYYTRTPLTPPCVRKDQTPAPAPRSLLAVRRDASTILGRAFVAATLRVNTEARINRGPRPLNVLGIK